MTIGDLATWLRAQLDLDEALAEELRLAAPTVRTVVGINARGLRGQLDPWDHRRWVAEAKAKRQILDEYEAAGAYVDAHPQANGGEAHGLWTALRMLAAPYSDRPGYRDEWTS